MTIEQVWHFQARNTPVPFLVLHRVRAGEGNFEKQSLSLSWCYTEFGQGRAAGLGDVTIEQVCNFQARNTPVPFLVLHRVRAGEGCRVAHMLECDTEPVALLT